MAGAHVEFTGDASGAQAAAAAAQAAIDSVHGKTVNVDVNVRVRQIGNVNEVAGAMDRAARAGERAAAGAREHERASDRAASSARAHAAASERASGAMGGLGDSSGRASGGLDRVGGSAQKSSGSLDRIGGSADRSSGSLGRFTKSSDSASSSSRALGNVVGGLGRALGGVGDGAGGASRGLMGSLGAFNSASSAAYSAAGALSAFGTAAAYSAAGSGILTAAVGALGVAGVAALGGVGVAAGLAGGAMASFAVNAHQDSAKFGADMKQLGQAAHLGAQMVSEPMAAAMVGLGRSMVSANNQLTPAGMGIASSLQEGFGTAAGVINRSSGSIVEAAGVAAAGFARLTAEAAPGVEAFLGQLPSLTAGAVSGMSQIASEFGRSAGAIEGATPALNRMMGAAGGLGAELVRIGAGSMVPFAENMTSMLGGATAMASQLAPAIKPSMQAFTDLANAGMGAIGGLSPEIAEFARAVSANSGGIQQAIGGVGAGMLAMGEAAAIGVGTAGPQIARMGAALQGAKGDMGDFLGTVLGGAADAVTTGVEMMSGTDPASKLGAQAREALGGGSGPGVGGRGAGAGLPSPGVFLGDQARALLGLPPSGMGAQSTLDGLGVGGWGGGFDRTSQTGGLMGMAGRALGGGGGAGAQTGGVAAYTGAGPVTSPLLGAQTAPGGILGTPADAGVGAIPSAIQGAMQQSQQAISGANLGGAVKPQVQAMTSAISGANVGGAVGGQMQSMTKTVENAAPAAAAAGSKAGGAIGGGTAAGVTSSMTIVDTLIINRMTQVHENAMGAIDAHSPSRLFEKTGRSIPQGLAQGVDSEFRSPLAATSSIMDELNAKAEQERAARRSRVTIRRRPSMTRPERAEKPDGPEPPPRIREEPNRYAPRAMGGGIPRWPDTREEADRIFGQGGTLMGGKAGGAWPNRAPDARGGWQPGDPSLPGYPNNWQSVVEGQWHGAIQRINDIKVGKGEQKRQSFAGRKAGAFDPVTREFADAGPGDPNRVRGSVYDKYTFGWNAKPGMDITKAKSMTELNSMIQSPLSAEQYQAMNRVQNRADTEWHTPNSKAFGMRTQQNLMRGRAGAFNVAGEIAKHEARQGEKKNEGDWFDKAKAKYNSNQAVGGSGGVGESGLSPGKIAKVISLSRGVGFAPSRQLGQNSALGTVQGLRAGAPAMEKAGGALAESGHKGYKKKDKQKSPSAVWADFGANSVAGLAGGITASESAATGAVGGMADSMHTAGAHLSDRGLMLGFTWAENIVTGSSNMLKRASYQSLGLPNLESQAAKMALAQTGLLKAGSGASSWKMPGNTPGKVTFGSGAPQTFTLNHNFNIDGQMHSVATQVFLDGLGQVTDAVAVQPR